MADETSPTTENQPPKSLWAFAKSGVIWALIQSWGSRLLTFVISIILARLLSPTEFGIAQASALLLGFVPLVAEFGFGAAIIQRKDLKPYEVNLPFFSTVVIGLLLLLCVVLFSDQIQAFAGGTGEEEGDLSIYITVAAGTVLLTLPTLFQEAFYKKHMRFKSLALRQMACNLVGGAAAVGTAFAGFGLWSFMIQIYIASIISAVWLWSRPQWLPSTRLDTPSFLRMSRFGLPIVGQRFNDFLGTRLIEFLIISQIGLAAYGLYAFGSRLYLLMLELLQRALYDVSLSVLSHISYDRERVGSVYLKTITLSSHVMAPIFVLVAALSPEIMLFLFGNKWMGVEIIATPLLLLGSLQCVQHMNGAFLTARGKPSLVLITGITKTVMTVVGLLLIPAKTVENMTIVFVLTQALAAPLSFVIVWRELRISGTALTWTLVQATLLCGACFMLVEFLRPVVATHVSINIIQGIVLGAAFLLCYIVLLVIFDRPKAQMAKDLVAGKLRKRKAVA